VEFWRVSSSFPNQVPDANSFTLTLAWKGHRIRSVLGAEKEHLVLRVLLRRLSPSYAELKASRAAVVGAKTVQDRGETNGGRKL
jgi:hypothetical protein